MKTNKATTTKSKRIPIKAAYWNKKFALQPHPEGGYFREIYRAKELIPVKALPARFKGPHAFSTSIYYLLAGKQISSLHRIASDEQWHFYDGTTLCLVMIAPDGKLMQVRLGRDADSGERFQVVIPAGTWMGAQLAAHSGYALIGCTVAPGFDYKDFEAGRRSDLLKQFPRHRKLILELTLPDNSP